MKKFLEILKMVFRGGSVPRDCVLVKSFGAELLAGRDPDKGAYYALHFGIDPDFIVHYNIYGLSWKEVRRNLAAVYSLWLEVGEAFLSPEVESELFKVYGALARIDYMNHSAYVPASIASRITLPKGSSCTRLAPHEFRDEVHDAENKTGDGDNQGQQIH